MCYIDTVKALISLTNVHNLSEIEIHHEMTRIRIKKNGVGRQISDRGFGVAVGGEEQRNADCGLRIAELTSQSEFRIPNLENEITSPMVGTFHRALNPGTKPYVDTDVEVDSETVVGVIETMKIINEVKAGVTGKVVEALVEDGEAVEFGQPLFRVQSV
jgi:acetyl-CoA carboxylase biotin carboxyl carrier protein